MTVTTTVAHAHEELREDHERLRGLVSRLRTASDPDVLAAALGELHAALAVHFNAEERPGGLYDALGVCVPELRAPLAALVDDHFRLAAALRDLRDRSRGAAATGHPALAEEASRLADALAGHERREHALVEAALGRRPQESLMGRTNVSGESTG